jgi:hypothetical protein
MKEPDVESWRLIFLFFFNCDPCFNLRFIFLFLEIWRNLGQFFHKKSFVGVEIGGVGECKIWIMAEGFCRKKYDIPGSTFTSVEL